LGFREVTLSRYRVVEICAGAGGQSLGLELAGFEHDLSVELDPNAAATLNQILRRLPVPLEIPAFEWHLAHLRRDFHIEVQPRRSGDAYKLGPFNAFTGQDDHLRHEAFLHPPRSANASGGCGRM
jgi:hypothetical protein